MPVTHTFVNAKADGADTTVTRPSDWNAAHVIELDYVEITSSVNITGLTEGTATTVVTGNAVTYDGSTTVLIEFYSPGIATPTAAAGNFVQVWLFDNGSSIGAIGVVTTAAAAATNVTHRSARRLTPSNASHTYSVRCSAANTTGTPIVNAGAGGASVYVPAFIRISKV